MIDLELGKQHLIYTFALSNICELAVPCLLTPGRNLPRTLKDRWALLSGVLLVTCVLISILKSKWEKLQGCVRLAAFFSVCASVPSYPRHIEFLFFQVILSFAFLIHILTPFYNVM